MCTRCGNVNLQVKHFASNLHIITPLNPCEAFFGSERMQIAPRSSTWWKNPLSGLHLIVPICKHETWITRRPPTSNWSTKNSWNFKVLWVGKIFTFYHPRTLPSGLAVLTRVKLLFPLCRSCAEKEIGKEFSNRTEQCKHSAGERALIGSWTTIKLEKAHEKDYVITYIYGILNKIQRCFSSLHQNISKWRN